MFYAQLLDKMGSYIRPSNKSMLEYFSAKLALMDKYSPNIDEQDCIKYLWRVLAWNTISYVWLMVR